MCSTTGRRASASTPHWARVVGTPRATSSSDNRDRRASSALGSPSESRGQGGLAGAGRGRVKAETFHQRDTGTDAVGQLEHAAEGVAGRGRKPPGRGHRTEPGQGKLRHPGARQHVLAGIAQRPGPSESGSRSTRSPIARMRIGSMNGSGRRPGRRRRWRRPTP